jgi:hypothetical protein
MPPLSADIQQLITLSAPFSGISAADHCASTTARVISLGLVIPICRLISGDKWFEITHASDFIRRPGRLHPGVHRHLLVMTDETESCRNWEDRDCTEDDFVFSLAEQALPPAADTPSVEKRVIRAGHAEIVGNKHHVPHKLIGLLQESGILRQTETSRLVAFNRRLREIFLAPGVRDRSLLDSR